jgi:hypothetical protein
MGISTECNFAARSGGQATEKLCKYCGGPCERWCDYPVKRAGEPATCDIPMCRGCALNVRPDRDYCRPHFNLAGEPQAALPPSGPEVVRWITAKYMSRCFGCGSGVLVGQRVLWLRQGRRSVVYCEGCGRAKGDK